jgi:hypothetical protein
MTPIEQRYAEAFIRQQVDPWLPKRAEPKARRRCSFDLPVGLADRFRSICTLQGHSMRDVAQVLLQAYVDRHDGVLGGAAA